MPWGDCVSRPRPDRDIPACWRHVTAPLPVSADRAAGPSHTPARTARFSPQEAQDPARHAGLCPSLPKRCLPWPAHSREKPASSHGRLKFRETRTLRWREPDSNHRSRKATGLLGIIPINLRDRFFLYGKMRLDRQLRPAVRIPFAPPTSPSQQGPADAVGQPQSTLRKVRETWAASASISARIVRTSGIGVAVRRDKAQCRSLSMRDGRCAR